MHRETTPLVGRTSLLVALGDAARQGHGIVLTGRRGSGGTRLLRDAMADSRRSGVRAAHLRPAIDGGRIGTSFLPLVDRDTAGRLPAGDHAALRAATVALGLEAVFVDEAHLIDEQTGVLLVELARSGTAVLANATGSVRMPEPLRRIIDEGRARAVPLPALTFEEVRELAERLLGDPVDSELALALATASEGRPGTLSEIVDDGVNGRAMVREDDVWRLAGPLPPARSLRAAVIEAFTRLPPDRRGWIVAVAQARSLADDLSQRIAAPGTIAAAAADGWTIRDDAARATRIASVPLCTAVLASVDLRGRVAVLRRLIAVAEAVPRPLTSDERIALAGWRIELGEPPEAQEAVELATSPSVDADTREALLRAAIDGGAPAEAHLADHLRRTRRTDEALELIATSLPDATTAEQRIALLRERAMSVGVVDRRPDIALADLDAALVDDPEPHPDLLAIRMTLLVLDGRPDEAVRTGELATSAPDASAFASALAWTQVTLARRERGELRPALEAAHRFAAVPDVDRAFPEGGALGRWLPWGTAFAVAAEPLDAERALLAEYDAVPEEARPTRRPPLAFTLGGIAISRGDPGAATRLLREADCGVGTWRDAWLPRVLAELAIAQALSGATQDAAATAQRLARASLPALHHGSAELALAQLAFARGDAIAARSRALAVADRAQRLGLILEAFEALFAAIRYGVADAPARLLELGPAPAGGGRDAQRAYAAALRRGDPHEVDRAAIDLWQAGLRLHAVEAAMRAVDLGAADAGPRLVAWLARVPSLRLPGVGDRRAGGLTSRVREVAMLAAAGASDRAIAEELGIALRTAQTHLGRAFTKLGVHRRTELRGLVDEP